MRLERRHAAARRPGRPERAHRPVSVGIRPEKLHVGGSGGNSLTGEIIERAYVGVSTQYVVKTSVGNVTVYVQGAGSHMPGEQLELSFAPEATFVVSRPEENRS